MTLDWNEHPEARQKYLDALAKYEGIGALGEEFADTAAAASDLILQSATLPWPGDPRVNIQNRHGKAKAYQVGQVLAAIEKKEAS
ncbi:hypothetical protein [Ruania zhangjianzhongii]|uniref:hypothetical protein n=1 Tax=Ruania zhangjianzhongii TaxID=2603206 RepID=UPI001FD3952F|nr:hypothetical protein [Ruania zhangjianzhongii]